MPSLSLPVRPRSAAEASPPHRPAASRASALQADRERLLLTEFLPEIAWTTTAEGANDFCNQRWTAYTGLTAQESRGNGWTRALHTDDLDDVMAWWQGCVAGTNEPVMRYRLRAESGTFRWYLCRAEAMRSRSRR